VRRIKCLKKIFTIQHAVVDFSSFSIKIRIIKKEKERENG